ncbi:MAG: hypothetical protein KA146_02800, partial [Leptospiraceae bacterium]|nr:hypothetical protein [Leptospiraceae bacterium]
YRRNKMIIHHEAEYEIILMDADGSYHHGQKIEIRNEIKPAWDEEVEGYYTSNYIPEKTFSNYFDDAFFFFATLEFIASLVFLIFLFYKSIMLSELAIVAFILFFQGIFTCSLLAFCFGSLHFFLRKIWPPKNG